jgi:tetratricopeptide (TPR) repeat protein
MSEYFIPREDAEVSLLACATYVAERIKGSDGRAEAISALVPLYLKADSVDMAAELANTVDDPFTRDRLLTIVAERCAELDDDEYALQLVDAIEEPGIRSEAIERIAIRKAQKGQLDRARELAERLEHPEFVYAAVAVKEAGDGGGEWRRTLDSIDFPNAKVQALLELASSAKETDRSDEVGQYLNDAGDAAGAIEHEIERIRALVETGNLAIQLRRNDIAIKLFDSAKAHAEQLENMHRDGLLAAASLGFLHAGSMDLAERALDLVADKTQIATVLLGYAREYWRKEEPDEALDALDEAYQILRSQKEIETRSSKARYSLMGTIAAQFAAFGKSERAMEIASTIEDEAEKVAALSQCAAILTQRREDEHAEHALRAIPDDADRAFALISMSDQKAKLGERDAARVVLERARHLIETVPQLSSRASAYSEIARRYAESGEAANAQDAIKYGLETVAAIRDESRRVTALCEAAALCGERRDVFGEDESVYAAIVLPRRQ